MARIDKIIDANKKLTIYELQGELSTEEMLGLNEEFFTGSSARNIKVCPILISCNAISGS